MSRLISAGPKRIVGTAALTTPAGANAAVVPAAVAARRKARREPGTVDVRTSGCSQDPCGGGRGRRGRQKAAAGRFQSSAVGKSAGVCAARCATVVSMRLALTLLAALTLHAADWKPAENPLTTPWTAA